MAEPTRGKTLKVCQGGKKKQNDGTVPAGVLPTIPKKKDRKKDKMVSKDDKMTSDINQNNFVSIGGSTWLDFGSVESEMSSKRPHESINTNDLKTDSDQFYNLIRQNVTTEFNKINPSTTTNQQAHPVTCLKTDLEKLLKRQAELTERLRKSMDEKNHMDVPEVAKTDLRGNVLNEVSSNRNRQFSPTKPISKISTVKCTPGPSPITEGVATTVEDVKQNTDPQFLETKRRVENLRRIIGLKKKKAQSLMSEIKSDNERFKTRTEEIITKTEEESKCPICMEQFGRTVLDRVVRAKVITPCHHVMCSKCYDDHVNGMVYHNKWCPTCRRPITLSFTLLGGCNLELLGLVEFDKLKKESA